MTQLAHIPIAMFATMQAWSSHELIIVPFLEIVFIVGACSVRSRGRSRMGHNKTASGIAPGTSTIRRTYHEHLNATIMSKRDSVRTNLISREGWAWRASIHLGSVVILVLELTGASTSTSTAFWFRGTCCSWLCYEPY